MPYILNPIFVIYNSLSYKSEKHDDYDHCKLEFYILSTVNFDVLDRRSFQSKAFIYLKNCTGFLMSFFPKHQKFKISDFLS